MDAAVREVFWNGDERRLRAPWRLLVGLVVVAAAGLAGVVLATVVGAAGAAGPAVAAVTGTVAQVAVYAALAGGVLAAAWLVDRRAFADLGLARSRAWWADLGAGLALGVALPGVVFAVELALGFVRVTGTLVTRSGPTFPPATGAPPALALALTAGYFLAVGGFEELLFRGYLLTNVAEGLRWVEGVGARGALVGATAATSLLFGAGHLANPNAVAVAVATITLYGGFLAAGYLLTGRLAVPVGFHVAWNFAVSSVFGFPVSGVRTPATLLAVEVTGPAVVTGGRFGPEAGLVSLVALVVGSAILAAWVRYREGDLRLNDDLARPQLRRPGTDDSGETE